MTKRGQDREVTVVTGTRAEYGLLKSSMEAIASHENLSLSIIATGMHLSPRHGMTVETIRDDGFTVDHEVTMHLDGDTGAVMAKSFGIGTMGLTEAFESLAPDLVLVLGDRGEALAAALSAAHMNIPVAHIHGGDAMQGATIDDSIRHALTKFAHIHFPASERSAERVRQLGEEPWRITTAGAPGLDDIRHGRYEEPEAVLDRYNLDSTRPLIIVLQHPVTTEPNQAGVQVEMTLNAVSAIEAEVVVLYPNSDAGSDLMIDVIEKRADEDGYTTFRNLPREEYLGLMAAADIMVGNSSSGIIEAPSLDLPVVDIGPRQANRERAANTVSVPHDRGEIEDAVHHVLDKKDCMRQAEDCANPYDHGEAGKQICQRLADIELSDRLLRKQLTF